MNESCGWRLARDFGNDVCRKKSGCWLASFRLYNGLVIRKGYPTCEAHPKLHALAATCIVIVATTHADEFMFKSSVSYFEGCVARLADSGW